MSVHMRVLYIPLTPKKMRRNSSTWSPRPMDNWLLYLVFFVPVPLDLFACRPLKPCWATIRPTSPLYAPCHLPRLPRLPHSEMVEIGSKQLCQGSAAQSRQSPIVRIALKQNVKRKVDWWGSTEKTCTGCASCLRSTCKTCHFLAPFC